MKDLALLCMRLAGWLMGRQAGEWSQAMRAELQHVQESERLSWAFGCLVAAIKRRFESMRTGTLRISRGILLLELLACFLPLTLGWWDAVFGRWGIARLDHAVIQDPFIQTPLGTGILAMMIGAAVIGLVGPIGLLLAARALATGTGLRNRRFGTALIAGVACYAVASIALRVSDGPGAYAATFSFILLLNVLPAVGIAHLIYLGQPPRPTGTTAVAA